MRTLNSKIPPLSLLPWGLLALLYFPAFQQMYGGRWAKIDYSHAYFILPVSLYLLWNQKERLRRAVRPDRSPWVPLIVLSAGLFLFWFGWRQEYLFIYTLSLIPVAWGLLTYLYGPRVGLLAAFPVLYLLFLVPLPFAVLDSVTLPMRKGVSVATDLILAVLNYPIQREGLLLSIGGQQIYLGEACSGFRSLIALAAVGSVYIYLSGAESGRKTMMALAIVPLALAGNLIRVLAITLVTYYVGVNAGQKFFHDFSGFLIFVILLAGLVWIEHRPE